MTRRFLRILTFNVQGWRTLDHQPSLSRVAEVLERADAAAPEGTSAG